jgi:hypothetical protein
MAKTKGTMPLKMMYGHVLGHTGYDKNIDAHRRSDQSHFYKHRDHHTEPDRIEPHLEDEGVGDGDGQDDDGKASMGTARMR